MYLTGTEGDDILVGTADADTLLGLGGDDTLQGGAGNDTLDGGAGSDTVSYADADPVGMFNFLMINLQGQYVSVIGPGGAPVDTLVSIENAIGSAGTDWLVGTSGDNQLSGGAGGDIIEGKGGADILDGGDGNDTINTSGIFGAAATGSLLIGGDGDDSIRSGNSNDTMLGGAGNDYLSVENYAVTRAIDGGIGTDTLAFVEGLTTYGSGVIIDLNKGLASVPGMTLTITGVENLTGTGFSDALLGDWNDNVLNGGAGDDTLYGAFGNDRLIGGDGADQIRGGVGQDILDGGAGADTFVFAPDESAITAPDTITAFAADDHIQFTDGPAGDGTNYAELSSFDPAAVDTLFAASGVRYVAMAWGANVYLFADTGDEGATYDQVVVLTGTGLSSIDAGSILGA
jgi:Ca2+-binding RTX toxin-like protein